MNNTSIRTGDGSLVNTGSLNTAGGMVNLGALSDRARITIEALPERHPEEGQPSLRELLQELIASVDADTQLPDATRAEVLTEVTELANAAQDPQKHAWPARRAINALKGLSAGISETNKSRGGVLEARGRNQASVAPDRRLLRGVKFTIGTKATHSSMARGTGRRARACDGEGLSPSNPSPSRSRRQPLSASGRTTSASRSSSASISSSSRQHRAWVRAESLGSVETMGPRVGAPELSNPVTSVL